MGDMWLEKPRSSPGRLGSIADTSFASGGGSLSLSFSGFGFCTDGAPKSARVPGQVGVARIDSDVGSWCCGCGGDPRCARRQLSHDVSVLLHRHQTELKRCLNQWSSQQEAFIQESIAKIHAPDNKAMDVLVLPLSENHSESSWPAPPIETPLLQKDTESPNPPVIFVRETSEMTPLVRPVIELTPSPRRSADEGLTRSANGSRSHSASKCSRSVCTSRSDNRGGCGNVESANLRSAAEVVEDSAVWITDIESPDSFKMHSRLDRMPDNMGRRMHADDCDVEAGDALTGSLSRSSSIAGLQELMENLNKSPKSANTNKDPPRRLSTAWGAALNAAERTSPPRASQTDGTSRTQGSPPHLIITEHDQEGKYDRLKTLASGRRRGKKQLSPLAKRKAQMLTAQQTRMMKVTKHPYYECISAVAIILNALFIVVETEYRSQIALRLPADIFVEKEIWMKLVADFFSCVFIADLAVRIFSERSRFLQSREKVWNIFDIAVVFTAALESLIQWLPGAVESSTFLVYLQNFTMLRIVRLLRVIRSTRAIRMSKFVRELRVMVYSLTGAMKSLGWAIVLILIILLIFGVFFTDAYLGHRGHASQKDPTQVEQMQHYFATLSGATVSLYMSMSGGADWGEVYEALNPLPIEYKLVFLVFVTFAVFALLNVITAVFVESAMQRSQTDRELLVQQELEQKLQFVETMQHVFEELDSNDSGTLTLDEFEKQIQDENILSYLSSLELDIDQVRTLLTLLDRDQNGEVDIEEFITGCLRLKGGAKSLDMAILQYQIEWILHNVEGLSKIVEERFQKFDEALATVVRTPKPVDANSGRKPSKARGVLS